MKVSIIIPSHGHRQEYLRGTLKSLQEQDFPGNEFEIIAVDNSPDGKVGKIVREINLKANHQVVCIEEKRGGLHFARHAGAKAARGDILVFIDDDVITHPQWLLSIFQPFESDSVACVGGKVLPRWETEVPFWFSQFNEGYLSLLNLGEKTRELNYGGIWGCNMAVKKDVLFQVGGFNPDGIGDKKFIWLRGDGECGLEEKILKAGYKVIYEPKAWLYHRIPASRLTPDYFYWRFFTQGITESYAYLRKVYQKKYFYLRMLKRLALALMMTVTRFLKLLRPNDSNRKIRLKADLHYWKGYSQHLLRCLLDSKLLKYVLKDSYI